MGFREQAAEAGLLLWRPIEGCHERSPLFVVEHESRLVRQGLFRFFASATHDEIRNVDALTLSGNFDQRFFRRRGAELEATVAGLVWSRNGHAGISASLYCRRTPARVYCLTLPQVERHPLLYSRGSEWA